MAHILLCWELGAGLGHAARLKALAQPLLARGHRVSFALRDLVHAGRLLAGLDVPIYQAPLWLHRVQGLPPDQAGLAEILLACGWIDPGAIAALAGGWRSLLRACAPDLVVADYAPCAVLAARTLGISSCVVGTAFQMPPAAAPLPPLRDWEAAPAQRLAAAEARVLDSANRVLAAHGAAPLAHAASLLLGDAPLLCGWPELDPWRRPPGGVRWFGPVIAPAAATAIAPAWPGGDGPRVFAYLRGPHPEHAAMLAALARAGCRTLCYLPEVAGGKAAPFVHASIAWARAPVALDAALAQAAFVVCHAGESTVAQALLAGRPLLMLPQTAEAFLTARRVCELGAGINVNALARPRDWDGIVGGLLGQAGWCAAAQEFAGRHAGFDAAGQARVLAAAIEETG
ncbi:glycosyltransferase [uncultured Massilia sp.]|uniref:glycosyltransferase n=1 Tax=uncultured Massilia sp. TaxID=169973 RepID=UPI0025E41245|nr:nucleotide disphospho-sugar-binding domain-containing protein [uncultured Massilia sp.]